MIHLLGEKEIRPLLDVAGWVELRREKRKGSVLMTYSTALDWV